MNKIRTSNIEIAGTSFKTKALAEAFIRAILSRHKNGQQVKGADLAAALAIIQAHPNRNAIEDCGIKAVFVQWLDREGVQRRFACVRRDNSIRDFTWRHSLHERTPFERVARVCRVLVRNQIEKARDAAFKSDIAIICPISGSTITRDTCDVDHKAPQTFQSLVEGWLLSNALAAADVEIVPSPNYQEPDRFEDVFLAENWREYHRINAVLRVVHPTANRSILRKGIVRERND